MTEQEMQLLERFIDGELPPDELAGVERRITDDPTWAEAHTELITLREILQADVASAVEAADFSDFFATIEARLPQGSPDLEAAPVVARNPPPAEAGWTRLMRWWQRNWIPATVGAAAAAAVAFWVAGPAGQEPADTMIEVAGAVVVDAVTNEGSKTVLISQPAEDEGATVIWLLDEEEVDGQPLDGEDPI